jgi:hypothetical protein
MRSQGRGRGRSFQGRVDLAGLLQINRMLKVLLGLLKFVLRRRFVYSLGSKAEQQNQDEEPAFHEQLILP